ncbi:MAG: M24 family metallopeptidase, partial [Polyangiales bacterium]
MASVNIASQRDIEAMRVVGRMAAETLMLVGEKIRAGMSTEDIDRIVVEDTLRRGAKCATLNYHGYPKSVCTSVNEVVCHGIPNGKQLLRDGDIVNVDVTTIFNGYFGDTSATFYV